MNSSSPPTSSQVERARDTPVVFMPTTLVPCPERVVAHHPLLAKPVARVDAALAHSSSTKMSISSEDVAPSEPETVTDAVKSPSLV